MPPKKVIPTKSGRGETSKSITKPTNDVGNNKTSDIPRKHVASTPSPEDEPHPKRQKANAPTMDNDLSEKIEGQQEFEHGPGAWVDKAKKIIGKGCEYQLKQFHDDDRVVKLIAAELDRLGRDIKRTELELDAISLHLGKLPSSHRWNPWKATRRAINALVDAHKDDIENG